MNYQELFKEAIVEKISNHIIYYINGFKIIPEKYE